MLRWFQTIAILLSVFLLHPTNAWRKWSTLDNGPGPRRGHSVEVLDDHLILFGGRGIDSYAEHIPKTYEIVEVDGKLEFSTYDEKVVKRSASQNFNPDTEECSSTDGAAANGTDGSCASEAYDDTYVPVGTYYNDIWSYNLACERYWDLPCETEAWQVVDVGAKLGGCQLDLGVERCTHPVERYDHNTELINHEFMVLFGGFSTFCEDFCDDLWIYFFAEHPGSLSGDWVELAPAADGNSPGKLWRAASVVMHSSIFVFGGHRLWHGFGRDNDYSNRFGSTAEFPEGGYRDDLWKLNMSSCVAVPPLESRTVPDAFNASTDYQWRPFGANGSANASANQSAPRRPGPVSFHGVGLSARLATYESCRPEWSVAERRKNCTSKSLFPDGSLKPGFTWQDRFDQVCVTLWPAARAGHSMVLVGSEIWLFGGYRTFFPYPNTQATGAGKGAQEGDRTITAYRPYPTYPYFLDDLWRYDTRPGGGYWRRVTPASPSKPAARMEHALVHTQGVLILFGGYHSNYHMNDMWLYNISANYWLEKKHFVHAIYPPDCQQGGWVLGFPTRGSVVDGLGGRAADHFAINYTRNQAPGWDGCRDRQDGRTDLPWQLQWSAPSQRSHHAAIYSEKFHSLLVYGGHGFESEQAEQVALTHSARVKGDLWVLDMSLCAANCSDHGECSFGYCTCYDGYYGLDCSNTSCAGDHCFYDDLTHEQHCVHCCSAPYEHTDADVYLADVEKIPCSREQEGESNGICDGMGTCQCRPPFIGDDCAIKDCPNDCSQNGWCSVEYPVSRCMCAPGYSGVDCSFAECLNNCSYPNGECVNGKCRCGVLYDPYNRSRIWRAFQGMDCSYVTPYAAASRVTVLLGIQLVIVLFGMGVADLYKY